MQQKVYQIIILILCQFLQSQAQNILFYSQKSIFSESFSIINENIQVSQNASFGIISSTSGELITLDLTSITSPKKTHLSTDYAAIYDILYLENQNLLIAAAATDGLVFFSCSSKAPTLTKLAQFGKDLYQMQRLVSYSTTKLIAICRGGFLILDITSLTSITILSDKSTFNPNINFQKGHLTPDKQFLLIPQKEGTNNGVHVISLADLTSPVEIKLLIEKTAWRAVPHPNPAKQYLYVLNQFGNLNCYDYSSWYPNPPNPYAPAQTEVTVWVDTFISQKNDIELTSDGNFALVSSRGYGIYIFDISNVNVIKLLQVVNYNGLITQMELALSNQYIFATSGKNLKIFNKTAPNLGQDQPNLFNPQKNFIWKNTGTELQPWDSIFSPNQNLLFVAYGSDGLRIFDSSALPQITLVTTWDKTTQPLTFCTNLAGGPTGLFLSKKTNNVLFVAVQSGGGLCVIDISNTNSPVQTAYLSLEGDHDHLIINKAETFAVLASGFSGIIIIDITNINSPSKISSIGLDGYSSEQDYGFSIYDISVINAPKLIKNVQTLGGEGVTFSKLKNNILFVADLVFGLGIFDLENVHKPNEIYKDSTAGTAYKVVPTQDEKFIFVASNDGDYLSLYDISNISQPFLSQVIYEVNEQAFRVLLSSNNDFAIVLTETGINVVSLKTSIKVNPEYLLFDEKRQFYVLVDQSRGFYVGEKAQIRFSILDLPLSKRISHLQIKINQKLMNLPSWMDYSSRLQTLSLQIDKEGIGNQLLSITTQIQVQPSDFSTLTPTQQTAMYNSLIDDGYCNKQGFLTDNFEYKKRLALQDATISSQESYARQVLNYKYFHIPAKLTIYNSLFFNPHSITSPIQTLSLQLKVQLFVEEYYGVFMKQYFDGLIVDYNTGQNILTMSGSLSQINSQLNLVRFSPFQKDLSNIQIKVTINDGINYEFKKTYNITTIKFLQLNHIVRVQLPLQDQLNKNFPEGEINIESDFSFQFSLNTFKDEDVLTYTAFFKKPDGTLEDMKVSEWLEFTANERVFAGKTNQKMYKKKYTFVLYASDGYTHSYSEFTVICSVIPFAFVISYIGILAGPLLSVIGAINNRIPLFHIFCKKKYVYSAKSYKAGSQFTETFILMKDHLVESEKVWEQFNKKTFIADFTNSKMEIDKQKIKEYIQIICSTNAEIKEETIKSQPVFSIILAWANNFVLNSDENYKQIYTIIIQEAMNQSKVTYKDYFKYFISVNSTIIKEETTHFFPEIVFFTNNFIQAFEKAYSIQLKQITLNNNIETNNNLQVDINNLTNNIEIERLIENCSQINYRVILQQIIYDTLGISPLESLEGSKGISLSSQKVDIDRIILLRKKQDLSMPKLISFLKLDYVPMEMSGNAQLPPWLQAKVTAQYIQIIVKPTNFDVGDYQLRIINVTTFIDVEYIIHITKNKSDDNDEEEEEKQPLISNNGITAILTQDQLEQNQKPNTKNNQQLYLLYNFTFLFKLKNVVLQKV